MIWSIRNKATHDAAFIMPRHAWQHAIRNTKDYMIIKQNQIHGNDNLSQIKLIKWEPPDLGFIKLNTDGAVNLACGLAGCGGVLRDSSGTWRGGFSKSLGRCTPYVAELWGILEGLLLTHKYGYRKLIVETDNMEITQILQHGSLGRGVGWMLLRRIRRLLQENSWSVSFKHAYREVNACAHLLASIGVTQVESFMLYKAAPVELAKAYSDDIKGVPRCRVVAG